jgi:hypothetical protein
MTQDCIYLFAPNAWKPFQKIFDRRPIAKVFEQSAHWHARTPKYPSPTDLTWSLFNFVTGTPIAS